MKTKTLRILVIAMLCTFSSVEFVQAVSAAEHRRKVERSDAKKVATATNNVLTSSPIAAAAAAKNSIDALNTAIAAGALPATLVSLQQTATKNCQNASNVYLSYLPAIAAGTAVTYVKTAAAPASATPCAPCVCPGIGSGPSLGSVGGAPSFSCTPGNTPTLCPSGAAATCADGTVVANVSCTPVDGSTNMSDSNGTCPGSLAQIPCNDGVNYPLCPTAAPDYGAIPC